MNFFEKISFLLTIVLCLSMCLVSLAETSVKDNKDDKIFIKKILEELDPSTIQKIYKVSENGLEEISIENAIEYYLEAEKDSIENYQPKRFLSTISYPRYDEQSSGTKFLSAERCSVPLYNDSETDTMANQSISCAHTQSHSINVSVNSSELLAVQVGVGYTWTGAVTVSSTNSVDIPPEHYGWFEFRPKVYYSKGYLLQGNGDDYTGRKWISVTYPKKLGGQCDGLFIARTSTTCPD
ncbi:hypothetical protein [Wukongibacter sp. M2B1]|uniref:hypothetical protein n=1 Tax=Wukongibacter sp. M2B1 TaxID=3088895 RepID=UPI003D7B955C